ncbi:hypothetical protein BH23CYA1_BH23CYA1_02010 [soil metagenome]
MSAILCLPYLDVWRFRADWITAALFAGLFSEVIRTRHLSVTLMQVISHLYGQSYRLRS